MTPANWASVHQRIAAFVRATGGTSSTTTQTTDPANDSMSVAKADYSTPNGNVMVRHMTVQGGGHA